MGCGCGRKMSTSARPMSSRVGSTGSSSVPPPVQQALAAKRSSTLSAVSTAPVAKRTAAFVSPHHTRTNRRVV